MKIRHLEERDHQDLYEIYSFSDVLVHTSQPPFLSSAQVLALFSAANQYTLVAEVNGKVVGHITLLLNPKVRCKHSAQLAIAVHPHHHGQGVGKTLLQQALEQADNWLNLLRVELEVHGDNLTAQALYQQFGFVSEGVKRLSTFKNGAYVDTVLMARIRPNYHSSAC